MEHFAQKQRLALTYENINLDFYGKFLRFLRTYPHSKAETYAENTVGNYIKKLKMFLNWSGEWLEQTRILLAP
ncbi:MAG: phage integrase SAM-like domain-containing protein [Lewinellaceae bacterium]|nr:phage integrase SAM-like domain-containing protein [Lewinellaceae bacterium]